MATIEVVPPLQVEVRCENCRFWARDDFGRALGGPHCDGSASDCRRQAPKMQESRDDRIGGYGDKWPTTRKTDWCGEFLPR